MSVSACSLAEFSNTFCLPAVQTVSLGFLLSCVLFLGALRALIKSSQDLLSGLERLCAVYHVAEDVVGATVLAFGGSVPELLVNLIATSRGETDMGASAIVGSGLIAYLLIPGIIIGFTATELVLHKSSVLRDSLVYLAALAAVLCFSSTRTLYLPLLLILIYALYLSFLFRSTAETALEKGSELAPLIPRSEGNDSASSDKSVSRALVEIGVASFVLSNMINYWTKLSGLRQGFLALVLVSLGAEIPDAVNAYTAATRGHGAMAMSACLGAQVVNLCLGLGLPWLIQALVATGSPSPSSLKEESLSFSQTAEKLLLGVVVCAVIGFVALPREDQTVPRCVGVWLVGVYAICVFGLAWSVK